MRYALCFVVLILLSFAVSAEVVNVNEETECAGETVRIAERALETGRKYETGAAPAKSGWVFTHWTISTTQDFADRDEWGRSLDVASFDLYESTTLTAHYLPAGQDADGDGVADGSEIYWYGNLSQGAASDTDGDGIPFAEELARGTNPIMAESADAGPVAWVAGSEWLFNPNDYGAVTIRSEPEGLLFATTREVYRPGTRVSTTSKGTYSPETTTFAYWSFNGERLADEWGRAEAEKTVVTDGSPLTIVAYAASDYETRMKLYWYGRTDVAMTSDTDGDGKTFAEELAAGTNPLMAESKDEGPVRTTDGVLWQYNPYNYQPYTMKSDPEGALFPTESYYVRAGTKVVVSAPGSSFYGWQVNGGEIRRDEWGRSEDAFTFTMPGEAVTLVAKTASDYETRMKLYWYGTTDIAMTSDTDGDGKTFAEELAAGRNPLMAETKDEGPVRTTDGVLWQYSSYNYQPVVEPVVTNTITYVGLEGAANTNVTEFTTNDLPLVLGPVERMGYTFLGWTPNDGVIPAGTVTNVAFTALWEEIVEPPPVEPVVEPEEPVGPGTPTNAPPTVVDEAETHVDVEKGEVAPFEDAAAVYDGYLYDGELIVGSVQVKVAKMKNDEAKVTATVQMAGETKKLSFKGGVADGTGAVTEMTDKNGNVFAVTVGVKGLGGEFRRAGGSSPWWIDGARNVFGGKSAEDKTVAVAMERYMATYNVAFDGGTLSVVVGKKGKTKVSGTVGGNKVSATCQLVVGDDAAVVPVVIVKKNVASISFCLWLSADEAVRGMATRDVGKAGALKTGAKFRLDEAAVGKLAAWFTGLYADCLPLNLAVAQDGKKWVVADGAKAGKLVLDKATGTLNPEKSKFTDNMAGLKLTYKEKDGTFKGSFKVYNLENGSKIKSYTATVTGVVIGDKGYGSATIKKFGTVAVTVE